ncbi:LAFE_0E01442g1_1 [Lachancea fermentati]|uniref:LAFE_0E01442g1_1 n=1 Tax=Lachancea fermentati TaxID=4955 RepID=A0A1G4MCL8_LACFM|nr:LAFE_0E01442g1_1 [Lachancea fermentati]
MFELPFVRANKRIRSRRKLRYQYIDAVNKRYQRLGAGGENGGLPTPENSAAEEVSDSNHQSGNSAIRRRTRKRRLQSVLGEAVSSESNESDFDEESEHNLEDYEKAFFNKHHKPQDTYEIWRTDVKAKTPIRRTTMAYSDCKFAEKVAQERISSKLLHGSNNLRSYFESLKAGYEICPRKHLESHQKTHIRHLNEILHLNITNGRWDVAYRCFSILIRLPGIDVRSVWGMGVRILHEVSRVDTSIGTCDEFLAWLSSVYSSRYNYNQANIYTMDPVFRSGSKTHTPKFVTTWLWEALIACSIDNGKDNSSVKEVKIQTTTKLELLLDKLSELVHVPPYMDDPQIWFIYAICHVVMVDQLSQQCLDSYQDKNDLSRDIARNQVIQHITNAKNCLSTCESKGQNFQFPKGAIKKQLAEYESRLYELSDVSSPSESEEQKSPIEQLDTQVLTEAHWSSDDYENYFGGSEQVQFGVESDSSD